MGETNLNVVVNSRLSGRYEITTSTCASYFDSDNNPNLKTLASYGCNVISDSVTLGHIGELLSRDEQLKIHR